MARDLIKWSHLPTISSLQNEMNRMLDRFFKSGDLSDFGMETGAWIPPIDLAETDEKFIIKAEIPGIDPKEIDISVKDNILLIKGEKKEEKEEKGKTTIVWRDATEASRVPLTCQALWTQTR